MTQFRHRKPVKKSLCTRNTFQKRQLNVMFSYSFLEHIVVIVALKKILIRKNTIPIPIENHFTARVLAENRIKYKYVEERVLRKVSRIKI